MSFSNNIFAAAQATSQNDASLQGGHCGGCTGCSGCYHYAQL
ncbi:hypothetical protein [Pseudoalteromonas byunsanensis]|nr:hypothetical protein [Pseudoalteromonas byunsanensis]